MNANLKKPSSQWKFVIFQENVVTVVGHRGFPRKFPDNTLAGFAAAFEIVGMVETDIRRSLDGLLVLSHDPEIDDRVVAETSWAEISEIDLGFGQNPMLLDDALSALPGHSWNLEVKNFPGEPGFEDHLDLAIETARRAGGWRSRLEFLLAERRSDQSRNADGGHRSTPRTRHEHR